MADVVVEQAVERPRMSWGSIFGGAVTALGLWILLYAFGLAIGLSSLNPGDPGSARPAGIFTGLWAFIAPLLALFVGGWVAGRGANATRRSTGATHGLVMWGLTTLLGVAMIGATMSALVGGAVSVGKAAVNAGGGAIGAVATGSGGAAKWLGIDANDAVAPINQRLRAEGKPQITPNQLQAATRDVAQSAVRDGRLDREAVVGAIVQNTNLSRADAEEIGDRVQTQVQQASGTVENRLQSAAQQAQTGALKVGDVTGKAFWGVFGALFLGLIAALVGGAVGTPGEPRHLRRERMREHELARIRERELALERERERARASAIATPREVHP
jgi:hypothetical protein